MKKMYKLPYNNTRNDKEIKVTRLKNESRIPLLNLSDNSFESQNEIPKYKLDIKKEKNDKIKNIKTLNNSLETTRKIKPVNNRRQNSNEDLGTIKKLLIIKQEDEDKENTNTNNGNLKASYGLKASKISKGKTFVEQILTPEISTKSTNPTKYLKSKNSKKIQNEVKYNTNPEIVSDYIEDIKKTLLDLEVTILLTLT